MTKYTGKSIFNFIAAVLSGAVIGMTIYRCVSDTSGIDVNEISILLLAIMSFGYSIALSGNKLEKKN